MINYYLICLAYCFFMTTRSYILKNSGDPLYSTPGLDSIVIIMFCWILAPVDAFIRWKNFYVESKNPSL